jgi:hypothetical protein
MGIPSICVWLYLYQWSNYPYRCNTFKLFFMNLKFISPYACLSDYSSFLICRSISMGITLVTSRVRLRPQRQDANLRVPAKCGDGSSWSVSIPLMPVITSAASSVSTLTNEVSNDTLPKHRSEIEGNRDSWEEQATHGHWARGDTHTPDLDVGRVIHGGVRGTWRPRRGHSSPTAGLMAEEGAARRNWQRWWSYSAPPPRRR